MPHKDNDNLSPTSETIPTIILSSTARIPLSFHRLDPCPGIWKVLYSLRKGGRSGSSQGGPVRGPHLFSMRSVEREKETLTEKRERERWGNRWKQNATELTAHWEGRGERQGERSLHIQAAHFLTNYCCKTSFSPSFPAGPLLSPLSLCGAGSPQELDSSQHCRQHKWQKLH